jgi:tRNA uridine 5-carboxymethylaminomethyl modification enzyme
MKIAVVGAGHAGIEAALSAAKMGADVILITIHLETIAQMSCNPSIGGIAKGHLVKEIDVLGGIMPRAADMTGIHFKILNLSKGPAVRATRTQNDKVRYRNFMKGYLENIPRIQVYQSIVTGIITRKDRVTGVSLMEGNTLDADAVIITAGTFLDGRIYIGDQAYAAGRSNELSSLDLARNIKDAGFDIIRLKTGTPMRVHSDSIDWEQFIPQPGDEPPHPFSLFTDSEPENRIVCYLGHTNKRVKKIIRNNLKRSPLYSGKISGIGPRYCPSIEDKIVKFEERETHHFYLEPEGLDNKEIYVNGLSSSLPVTVQKEILKAIPGLDRSIMMRPAYAIEYDAIQPTQLRQTLESRSIRNLFFAGQVNGTSGYEEAAAQGLIAGINSVLKVKGEEPFILDRNEAYIGVMIDDIVNKGVDEPYRLFTSRAEFRLQLREDNAFERLGHYALKFGLLDEKLFSGELRKLERRKATIESLRNLKVKYRNKIHSLFHLLKMPEITFEKLLEISGHDLIPDRTLTDTSYIEATVKYEGYIKIQNEYVERMKNLEKIEIPVDLDYDNVDGLSIEVRQKLTRDRPPNLKQALRISGITPASINAIQIYLTLKSKT